MMDQGQTARSAAIALLRWYASMGVGAIVGEAPLDRLRAAAPETGAAPGPVPSAPERTNETTAAPSLPPGTAQAQAAAQRCRTLDELREALETFEGCALKNSATQLVFADGAPGSAIMLIGEAPGREEDRQGKPFVGRSGQLLDRMLAGLGLTRQDVYITNIVPWRPPLNRKPELSEIQVCLPFLLRHIELAAPKVVMTLGGTATQHLLGESAGIMQTRGRWYQLQAGALTVPVMPTLHPAYLLRTPAQKRLAWKDFLAVKLWLDEQQK